MTWSDYYEKINGWAVSTAVSKISRQQVDFRKESSKYAGCEILKRNFYTRFIPEK